MNSLRYGWRNLWRNTTRTLITVAAAAFSTAVLIASFALMDGLVVHAVGNITNLDVGEVQVHARGYLADRSIYESIRNPAALLADARQHGIDAAPRALADGLIAFGNKSVGAQVWGVEPPSERAAFTLAQHVAQGRFLPDAPQHLLVIGRRLAESLGAHVGSEVVLVVQAADGSLGNDLFTVAGILQTADADVDSGALMHAADFGELFVSDNRIQEIALNSHGRVPVDALASMTKSATPGEDVRTWRELMPAFSDMLALFDGFSLGLRPHLRPRRRSRRHEHDADGHTRARPRIRPDQSAGRHATRHHPRCGGRGVRAGGRVDGRRRGAGRSGVAVLQRTGIDTSRWAGSFAIAGVAFIPCGAASSLCAQYWGPSSSCSWRRWCRRCIPLSSLRGSIRSVP